MRLMLMVSLALLGCKKKVAEPTGPEPPRSLVHPDLQCPQGTIGTGTPPPDGLEIFCAIWAPDGSLTKHGPYISWHNQARRKARGEYLKGVRSGKWVFWHPTGSPAEQGEFIGGKKEGIWEAYHLNGNPASKGMFVTGKEHGDWTYWNEDNSTSTSAHWLNGERDGRWVVFNKDNQELREQIYANGRLQSQRELMIEQP